MRFRTVAVAIFALATPAGSARAETSLRVLAAGSLREVMGEIGTRYKQATGVELKSNFGPSGVLHERIEKGEAVDLFASADMGHR